MKATKSVNKYYKYQRCDECHGRYLIVFECKDKKKRCARCKERFDGKEGGNERGKGDKRSIKEVKGPSPVVEIIGGWYHIPGSLRLGK